MIALASACAGFIIGFFLCAFLTAGKVADLRSLSRPCDGSCASLREENDVLHEGIESWSERAVEATYAHARAADALNTKQSRIDRALACETPKAAHGVKKMARILRGDA